MVTPTIQLSNDRPLERAAFGRQSDSIRMASSDGPSVGRRGKSAPFEQRQVRSVGPGRWSPTHDTPSSIICDRSKVATDIVRRVPFNDLYKEWRNLARRFDRESIIRRALDELCEPSPDMAADLAKAPWLTLLMIKWVCQDRLLDRRLSPPISVDELNDLRQRLLEFPERLARREGDTMPAGLFMRRLIRPQLGFQRGLTTGFVREAALLADQPEDHPLRKHFYAKTGLDVLDFIDFSLASWCAVSDGRREIRDAWFSPLAAAYGAGTVARYQSSVARTVQELVVFCRSLPDAKRKVASEYFEFPVLARYPFLRREGTMVCWHPAVFYRGLESFVHSVLSEEGHTYMKRFSQLFERHVVAEAKRVPTRFIDEDTLRSWIAVDTRVPDGLLSFPDCNIFVEAKAGLWHESVMTIGTADIFSHQTKAIRTAVMQAWATSVSLRQQCRAPAAILHADVDYLLIVTNKELGVSSGTALAAMYPEGKLAHPDAEAEKLLPWDRIYILALEDFERMTTAAASRHIDVPTFLASCVDADQKPATTSHLFEQHLRRHDIPQRFSAVVENAVEASLERLESAMRT